MVYIYVMEAKNGHHFGVFFTQSPLCSLCDRVVLFVNLVIFHFGFEGRTLILIVIDPCYCLHCWCTAVLSHLGLLLC